MITENKNFDSDWLRHGYTLLNSFKKKNEKNERETEKD